MVTFRNACQRVRESGAKACVFVPLKSNARLRCAMVSVRLHELVGRRAKGLLWSMRWHFAVALLTVCPHEQEAMVAVTFCFGNAETKRITMKHAATFRCDDTVCPDEQWLWWHFCLVLLRQKDYYDGLVCGGAPCMCGAAATNQITMSCDSIYFIFCLFYDIG